MSANPSLLVPSAEYMAGSKWISEHLVDLVSKYPNHWVAVYRGRVVGADPGLGNAQDAAEKSCPPSDIAYRFVDNGTLIF